MTPPQSEELDLDRTVRTRLEAGARGLQAIGGLDYDGPLKKVVEVSPNMADLLLMFPYGDVMSRSGLAFPLRRPLTAWLGVRCRGMGDPPRVELCVGREAEVIAPFFDKKDK